MFEEFTGLQEPKLRVFEAFSGIGTQRMALRNLGIPHEVVAIAEIDKFAIKSYEAIHGHTYNLGDISEVDVDDIPDHDLFTYSFPCQDISLAGKQGGLDEGSGTRSSLLWECRRVIEAKKPTYLMLENVKNLVGKKHKPNFEKWLEWLEEQGYTNYWDVLNAKDYGVPQNRERVFVISILGDHEPYEFPEKEELTVRLKDVLEDDVEEKFYLSEEKTKELTWNLGKQDKDIKVLTNTSRTGYRSHDVHDVDGVSPTIAARDYKGPKQIAEPKVDRIGGIFDKEGSTHQAGSVYDKEQLAPTLDTMQGGWRQPSILVKNATIKGYAEAEEGDGIDLSYPNSKTRRGRVQKDTSQTIVTDDSKGVVIGASGGRNPENPSDRTAGAPTRQRLEINKQGTSNTITTVQKDNYVVETLGTLAAHNSKNFGSGYMKDLSKTLKANKHDISVVEQVKWLAETARPNDEIGVTLKANGDIRPHQMDKKKSGIQELNINHENNSSHTVTSAHMPKVYGTTTNLRIRKLTPKECWRLMGCSDEDFEKAQEVNSNTQLYKQAGNAIVVDVLEKMFEKLIYTSDTNKTY